MTDSKALIERLREPADWAIERPLMELRNEAADAIEKLEADNARLREALGSAIRNIENLTADIEAHKECAECQNNIEMYVEATGIYRAALAGDKP